MKLFSNKYFPLFLTILFWSIFHIYFFQINQILKNADSFAYLQMSYHFQNFSLEWFWTWWFWFFYSLLIAWFNSILVLPNEYFVTLFLNIILFWIWAYFLYKISKLFLDKKYSILVIVLYYLSPILLDFNITILSENIYIPLFLMLIYYILMKFENKKLKIWKEISSIFIISFFLALLYFTRAEAFIYIWSVVLIFFLIPFNKTIFTKKRLLYFFKKSFFLVFFFFLIIFPYLIHLHSITWEWWLTNKWSANLRQAELRWSEKMDDEGFEQAVWELTFDNHYLKSWFVWGLKYNKWEETKWIKNYILEKPFDTFLRILKNQKKLYFSNLPEIISGNAKNLFNSKDSFLYKNYLFFIISIFPLFLVLYWIYMMIKNKNYDFLIIFFSFFLIASLFFTLFFVLNRYFIIFLPLFLVLLVYGIKNIKLWKYFNYLIIFWIISFYFLWNFVYYNSVKNNDYKYEIKKTAGIWLKQEFKSQEDLKIMERFPITTYYSWTKERWLTPYTDNIENLIEYARYNKIKYLVVDSLDFKTYRPNLVFLLLDNYENKSLNKIVSFQENWEKLILYKFIY